MSFLHTVRVGFFGTAAESSPGRELQLSECVRLLIDFERLASDDLKAQLEQPPRGNTDRGFVLAYAAGYPILLRKGVLVCPYLSTYYILSSIAFATYVYMTIGCSIYSEDEGRFLSIDEFVPEKSLAEIIKEVAK